MRIPRLSLLVLAVATFAFASCGKTEGEPNLDLAPESGTVTFEAAQLPSVGYLINSAYVEKGITFHHNYDQKNESWDGFAVSNKTDKTTAGYGNMYSVYGDGGADNSAKFGVASLFGATAFSFAGKSERIVDHVYITNSTYAYLAIKDGNDGGFGGVTAFAKGDWFRLTINGYDAKGTETGEETLYLADYRGDEPFILQEWKKVDLTGLGEVNKVTFSLHSSDTGDYGINTPASFCIDNISYARAEPTE